MTVIGTDSSIMGTDSSVMGMRVHSLNTEHCIVDVGACLLYTCLYVALNKIVLHICSYIVTDIFIYVLKRHM